MSGCVFFFVVSLLRLFTYALLQRHGRARLPARHSGGAKICFPPGIQLPISKCQRYEILFSFFIFIIFFLHRFVIIFYTGSVSGAESALLVMAEANRAKRQLIRPQQPNETMNFNPSQVPSRDNTCGNATVERGYFLGAAHESSKRRQ